MRQLVLPIGLALVLLSGVTGITAHAQDFPFGDPFSPDIVPAPEPTPDMTPTPDAAASTPAPTPAAPPSIQTRTPPASSITPEMWLFLQEYRRWNDPKEIVRRRAAERAEERRMRMAALEWYGLSNQRPMAHPTPHTASYSPTWVGGLANPYLWPGIGAYPRVIRVYPTR